MGALSKVLMASFFLGLVAGCGSGGGDPTALYSYPAPAAGKLTNYYNPTSSPITIEIGDGVATGVAKTADLLTPGDSYTPNGASSVVVEGCTAPVEGSEVSVCWAAGYDAAAQYLYAKMPEVLSAVRTFGEPGPVDVIVGNPANYTWGGEYSKNRKIALVTSSTTADPATVWIAIHELTHAAFSKTTRSNDPGWLNEAMATTTSFYYYGGRFYGNEGLYATPSNLAGYARVQAIGTLLREFRPNLNAETIKTALDSGDAIKYLTGEDTVAFSRLFWQRNKDWIVRFTNPGRYTIPPYSAVSTDLPAKSWTPLEIFEGP